MVKWRRNASQLGYRIVLYQISWLFSSKSKLVCLIYLNHVPQSNSTLRPQVKIKSGWSDGLFYTCNFNDGLDEKVYHQNSEDYMTIAEDLDPSIQYNIWCRRNNEASWGVTTVSVCRILYIPME